MLSCELYTELCAFPHALLCAVCCTENVCNSSLTDPSSSKYHNGSLSPLPSPDTPRGPGLPRDCREVYQRGCTTSGVYTIDPQCPRIKPFNVWCDMDNGQWVVFQKRKNGEVNFTRGWSEYVNGFGDPKWEYWLGLEKIHCLTAAVFRAELRVDLGDFDGNKKYAQYNFISVNNNLTNYRLDIGLYSGNAGNALRGVTCISPGNHDGMAFSTYDRNGVYCAQSLSAGWWYNACYCANLNGPYNGNNHWTGFATSHKSIEMKLRTRD